MSQTSAYSYCILPSLLSILDVLFYFVILTGITQGDTKHATGQGRVTTRKIEIADQCTDPGSFIHQRSTVYLLHEF